MNKQELIECIDKLPYVEGPIADTVTVNRCWILETLKQLDEPKEVAVPQFVADWYEERKDDLETALFRCVDIIPRVYEDGELNQFQEWFINGETKPFQTLVNMHQFGYTVEKEPKYTVKIKSVNQYLVRNTDEDFLGFLQSRLKSKFTRKELEDVDFGWVFDCPGIEIEEVEE